MAFRKRQYLRYACPKNTLPGQLYHSRQAKHPGGMESFVAWGIEARRGMRFLSGRM
ncbi:hypothetical protein C900_02463 [Fulvivirga imtechensis AK7]|uniref:Uncharacterized protein n=1 Tax=Fulvivirga imtechensis AK7 TaxID=1237149 RepID=L8JTH9_9BACT|nr:hypothetical protein C900_02463 [Fulvivirga imtechensis AK7]